MAAFCKESLAQKIDKDADFWRQMAVRRPEQVEMARSVDVIIEHCMQLSFTERTAREKIRHASDAEAADGGAAQGLHIVTG